jgi:hypothetical protein
MGELTNVSRLLPHEDGGKHIFYRAIWLRRANLDYLLVGAQTLDVELLCGPRCRWSSDMEES